MTQIRRRQALRAAGAAALTVFSIGAVADMPSTLRSLRDRYEVLCVGTTIAVAIQLMGDPKTRAEHTVLGVPFCEMTWVDVGLIRYHATFVADRLIEKSNAPTTMFF